MERNGDPRMNLSEQEEDLRRQRAARQVFCRRAK